MARLSQPSVLACLTMALAACASERPEPAPAEAARARPHVMTVTVGDYFFQAPDSVPAGLVMIQALMRGEVPHHVTVIKLEENRTAADYVNAVSAGGPPPNWAVYMGGPNPTEPGTTANAMLVLEPGNYALVCFVDIPEATPHFARGMFRDLKVYARPDTGDTATASAAPTGLPPGDVTIRLVDYDFLIDKPLRPGLTVFRVENEGPQEHEVFVAELRGNTTLQQALGWLGQPEGPPPFVMQGGIAFISPGQANNFTLRLSRGRYGLFCFIPDRGDGRPHFMHGMVKEIEVR